MPMIAMARAAPIPLRPRTRVVLPVGRVGPCLRSGRVTRSRVHAARRPVRVQRSHMGAAATEAAAINAGWSSRGSVAESGCAPHSAAPAGRMGSLLASGLARRVNGWCPPGARAINDVRNGIPFDGELAPGRHSPALRVSRPR